jgi:hypothetical protein
MATTRITGHNAGCCKRRSSLALGFVAIVFAGLLPISGTAQNAPRPAPTMITPPSLPVRGQKILRTLPSPGAMSPTPPEMPPPEHLVGIIIAGFPFMMHPGPCAHRVEAAILAHDDLFTGDSSCDTLIKRARAIQRQKEAEDPDYANEPRITPEPTPTPHWVTAPSLPVRGPIISHTPIPLGAMVPTPGMISPPVHPVLIRIHRHVFSMRRGHARFGWRLQLTHTRISSQAIRLATLSLSKRGQSSDSRKLKIPTTRSLQ